MNTNRPTDYGAAWSAWQQHEEQKARPSRISMSPDWQAQCRAMAYRAEAREARRRRLKSQRIAWCLCGGILLTYLAVLLAEYITGAIKTHLTLPTMLFMGGVLATLIGSDSPAEHPKTVEDVIKDAGKPHRPTLMLEYLGKCHAHGGKHRVRCGDHTEYGDSPGEAIGRLAIRLHNEYGPFVFQIV